MTLEDNPYEEKETTLAEENHEPNDATKSIKTLDKNQSTLLIIITFALGILAGYYLCLTLNPNTDICQEVIQMLNQGWQCQWTKTIIR